MSNFKLGKIVATAAVVERMQKDHVFAAFVSKSIRRYEECDWGDTCEGGARKLIIRHSKMVSASLPYTSKQVLRHL